MRAKIIFTGISILVVSMTALFGCDSADQSQSRTNVTQDESRAMAQPAATSSIDYCIVSGEKLGSMGDPIEYDHEGRTVRFCCNSCVKKFKADPTYYIAKLDSVAAGLQPGQSSDHDDGHDHSGHDH